MRKVKYKHHSVLINPQTGTINFGSEPVQKILPVDLVGNLVGAAIVGLIAVKFGWWILAILLIMSA